MSDIDLQKVRGAVLGAFLGDSLALGPHWMYDQAEIEAKFGRITELQAPATQYHPGKEAGDFTHLGDQTMLLLEALELEHGEWKPARFQARWQAFWSNPSVRSYQDKATKQTLAHLEAGREAEEAGSSSEEFAGGARGVVLAAILTARGASLDTVRTACREQCALTHRSDLAENAAEWVGEAVWLTLKGGEALKSLDQASEHLKGQLREELQHPGSQTADHLAAAKRIGLGCSLPGAAVVTRLLLGKFGEEAAPLLTENAMTGGDSAARGLVLGALAGAEGGADVWPATWLQSLRRRNDIEAAVTKMASL